MAYQYLTNHNASAYTPRAQVRAVFGFDRPAVPLSDIIHHWDDPAKYPTFEGTVRWFEIQPPAGSSSHYVLEAGRVACMVNEADAAHTNGHAGANAKCVAWECNPRCSLADQETLADALSDAWVSRGLQRPGLIELHRQYQQTECPGRWVAAIDNYVRPRAAVLFYEKLAAKDPAKPDPTPVKPPVVQPVIHVVKAGESLSGIAAKYRTTVNALLKLNTYIKDPNYLAVGDRVRVK